MTGKEMTDREMLEMAAKAAGCVLDYSIRPDRKAFYHSDRNAVALADGGWFAPLTDDGDAFRLAVKFELEINYGDDERPVANVGYCKGTARIAYLNEPLVPDPYAATRRAIVRAAAEIGKAML